MIRRILNAYSNELASALRQKSTYLGPILIVIIILLTPFAYPIQEDADSDYDFLAYVLPLSINVFSHFMVLIYTATLISMDLQTGMIRTTMTRPLRRREYWAAKFLHGVSYMVVLNVVAFVTALGLVQLLGNLSGVYFADELLFSDREMLSLLFTTMGLTLLPQCAVVAYALFFSTATRNPTTAIVLSVGGWLGLEGLKYPLGISRYVYSTYAEVPWTVFSDRCSAFLESQFLPDAYWGSAISVVYILVFTCFSLFILSRRNLVV